MVENKSSIFGIIAIIIGASGLGLGAFSVVNFQLIEGPQGLPGEGGQDGQDGTDGQDIVGLQVGILDPDHYEVISGIVLIRVLLWNSSKCSINVFINGTLNATTVPWEWDTTIDSDGWYNVSVRAMDTESNVAQDEVMVYVLNNPGPTPRARVYRTIDHVLVQGVPYDINFNAISYDTTNSYNPATDRYIIPEDGYYLLIASAVITVDGPGAGALVINVGQPSDLIQGSFLVMTASAFTISITDIVYLSQNNYVKVYAETFFVHGSLTGGSQNTFFSITKLSD